MDVDRPFAALCNLQAARRPPAADDLTAALAQLSLSGVPPMLHALAGQLAAGTTLPIEIWEVILRVSVLWTTELPFAAVHRLVHPHISPGFLEKLPAWRRLRTPKALAGFVRSLCARQHGDERGPAATLLAALELPAWPASARPPAAGLGWFDAGVEDGLVELARAAVAEVDALPPPRLLYWPAKEAARRPIGLLVCAQLWRMREQLPCLHELQRGPCFDNAAVDAAAAALFAGKPDYPAIRRWLLSVSYLTIRGSSAAAQPADPTTPGQAAASAQDHSATPLMQLNVPLLARECLRFAGWHCLSPQPGLSPRGHPTSSAHSSAMHA